MSVIIPALNEEKLIGGMLRQFTPDVIARHRLEIIVSDGGSVDGTVGIARQHAQRVLENTAKTKQTISLGRNLGAAQARGDVLVFLNADTLIKDIDLFFRTVSIAIDAPGVAALTCNVEVYPEEQRRVDHLYHGFYNWFFWMMNRVGMGMGRGECHVIRRDVFDRVQGYEPRITAGEDYDLFRRLAVVGRVVFLRELVVFESPRRFRRYGYAWVTASWFLNFLSVFFLRRSIQSEWKPVR